MNFDTAFNRLIGHEDRGIYLRDAIKGALFSKTVASSNLYTPPKNSRSYGCSVPECERPAYAKGMCNAHYMRNRSGNDMATPLRARKRNDECVQCGEKTGAKGGWGLCSKHYKRSRYELIKGTAVKVFGDACSACGGKFPLRVFDFHHIGDKSDSPSTLLCNSSPERIAEELANCVLLCANCHRLEHNDGF